MSLFSSILSELSKKIQGAELFKNDIAQIVSDTVGVSITKDQLEIKEGKLFISVSPTIKTKILFKKDNLLQRLQQYKIKAIV